MADTNLGCRIACIILAFILFPAIFYSIEISEWSCSISCSCNVNIMIILQKYQNGCQNRDFCCPRRSHVGRHSGFSIKIGMVGQSAHLFEKRRNYFEPPWGIFVKTRTSQLYLEDKCQIRLSLPVCRNRDTFCPRCQNGGNDDKQKRKLYCDELVLILFDTVDKSPGFFHLDLKVFGLLGLRSMY